MSWINLIVGGVKSGASAVKAGAVAVKDGIVYASDLQNNLTTDILDYYYDEEDNKITSPTYVDESIRRYRRSDARILKNGELYGIGKSTLDLRYGGNYGYSPRVDQWLNNKSYVARDLVPVVLSTPKMFNLFKSEEMKWVATLKSFIELHCKTIEGYKATLTVNVVNQPVRDEMQQDPTRVTRERSEPVFGCIEKEGTPIQNFLEWWITYGILDPDSGRVLASSLEEAPTDWLADWYSMSLLVFEPDTMFRHCMRAWVSVNMYPLSTGDIIGSKDPDNDKALLELAIPFSALSVSNEGTRRYAETLLRSVSLTGAIPHTVKLRRDHRDENYEAPIMDRAVSESESGFAGGLLYVKENQLPK